MKIIVYLVSASVFLFILYRNVAPRGEQIRYRYNFEEDSKFISRLGPPERVSEIKKDNSNYYQALKDDLVYFDLKLNKKYSEATVKVRFKNKQNPEFLIGIRDLEEWHYSNKPLDNKVLNTLKWNRLEENGLVLYQKKKRYENVKDFFENLPQKTLVATYYFEPSSKIILEEYEASGKELAINYALRGPHTLYTYVGREPLDFAIEKQDLNWYEGADILTIDVLKGNERVYRVTIGDDGILDSSKKMVAPQITRIEIPRSKLPGEGVYKVQLSCSEDVLVRKILTKQKFLVFENKVFLAENKIYTQEMTKPATIFTDARAINVATWHKDGLQTLKINNSQALEITKEKIDYRIDLDQAVSKIESERGDIIISGSGFFSFSKASYFRPKPFPSVNFNEKTDLSQVDYIVADYSFPKRENGWMINEQTFDLSKAYIKDGKVSFMFSAPGLKESGREILIDYIEITLKRPGIFSRK